MFTLKGARLFRALFARQDKFVARTIAEKQPFLVNFVPPDDEESWILFRAVMNGDADALRRQEPDVLKRVACDVPVLSPGETSPRVSECFLGEFAAINGDRGVIDVMFEAGLFKLQSGKDSPIFDSAYYGNVVAVRRLIELGFEINAKDKRGSTALHYAVTWRHTPVVRALLEHGVDCNARDRNGETPLFCARSPEIAKLLIDAGCDVNAVNKEGLSCIYKHLQAARRDIADKLKKAGAEAPSRPPHIYDEIVDPEQAIRSYLTNEQDETGIDVLDKILSTDFGHVLPVRSISQNELRGSSNK